MTLKRRVWPKFELCAGYFVNLGKGISYGFY